MRERVSKIAGWVSVASNLLLTLLKLVIGFYLGSQVLIADGVHSAADVVASVAALGAMTISNRPADKEHPYGHGKAEVVASGIVSVILIIAAVGIAYKGFESLLKEATSPHLTSLFAALFSLVAKQVLYVYTYRLGKKYNSQALIATAIDHQADVYASLAAVIGIAVALVGQATGHTILYYADPVAGILVAALILKLAYHIGSKSVDTLMEKNVPPELLEDFERIIYSVPKVRRIDRLRAREHGHYILVDVRVGVPGQLSIQEGHDVANSLKKAVMEKHPNVQEVLVHINPWYAEDDLMNTRTK
jgi:cation diffusion facilitator family transporter